MVTLTPEELMALRDHAEGHALTIVDQGAWERGFYTRALAEGAEPPFQIVVLCASGGVEAVTREELKR